MGGLPPGWESLIALRRSRLFTRKKAEMLDFPQDIPGEEMKALPCFCNFDCFRPRGCGLCAAGFQPAVHWVEMRVSRFRPNASAGLRTARVLTLLGLHEISAGAGRVMGARR